MSRVEVLSIYSEERREKAVDQGVDLTVQIKELIEVLKAKILLEKKNLLWGDQIKIDPGGYP